MTVGVLLLMIQETEVEAQEAEGLLQEMEDHRQVVEGHLVAEAQEEGLFLWNLLGEEGRLVEEGHLWMFLTWEEGRLEVEDLAVAFRQEVAEDHLVAEDQ